MALSNLGSIRCPAVYHHLNNYGNNSIMVTIGTIHKEEVFQPDGSRAVRDIVDVGVTWTSALPTDSTSAAPGKLYSTCCLIRSCWTGR